MSEARVFQALTCCIEVSADALTATLRAPADVEVLAANVIAQLKEIGIVQFDDGQLIEALEARKGRRADAGGCAGGSRRRRAIG